MAEDPTGGMDSMAMPVDLLSSLESVRTGYVAIDTLLCLLVPLVLQQVLTILQDGTDASLLALLWARNEDDDDETVERTIEITKRRNHNGEDVHDWEQKNHMLQKAISLYISAHVDLQRMDAKYELIERSNDDSDASTDDSSSDGSCDEDSYNCSEVEKLGVQSLPLENQWIEVEKGLKFKHEILTPENPGEHKGVTETKVIFRFEAKRRNNGSDQIDAFIERAYTAYQEAERKKVHDDTSRYFYIQSGTKSSQSDAEKQVVAYKRYALGEEKTFENLFFDEKEQVISLLDNFMNKSGKFAIKGFPYKLGFLLHGPPGTGKTSLIKAIAAHAKRHIVTINLGKIKSNQELMDAVFDLKFAVQDMDYPISLSFEDVIFVMEDIDCASSIVTKREDDSDDDDEAGGTQSPDEVGKELEAEEDKSSKKRKKKQKKKASVLDADEKYMSAMMKLVLEDEKKNARLNLAGLLNVLDGVIDCPGRIIIMTTNHPEKLDPALIRPGRVNKKLYLSYMDWRQVRLMIEYYSMTALTAPQVERLELIFSRATRHVSPAEVEEFCAEYDSVPGILDAIERLSLSS
ncbi:hypothetical protein P43SY_007230 [Pythium insidiosum]|uniref:AAA+ ATPase domain-containing protein n=1 Tax=Pythium insidiosum TaxID=114742 RepID=A0AAD5Q8P6_PYTIN|nr:hypothetical protein P43SY_007230 [Pythium insidiosum]